MQALVIGNGESRKSIDISEINCTKYGCNAVHRDLVIDHLICVDSRMVDEALLNVTDTLIYTRHNWINQYAHRPNVRLVPDLPYKGNLREDDPWHWGSGPYAVLLSTARHDIINLVGFDLYSKDGLVNNVYKDTKNYLTSDKPKVDPRYWIYQIGRVFECNSKKQFRIFNEGDWELPRAWDLPNVAQEDLQTLATLINSSV
jgi:hypothetical protein